jgi:hypothetical protein
MRATLGPLVLTSVSLLVLAAPPPASASWPPFGRALSTAFGTQGAAAIASDGTGGAIVVWNDRRAFPFNIDAEHVLSSGDVDVRWPTNGRALLTDALAQTIVPQGVEFPAIVSDGAGGAIVTWPDARNALNGLDIYAHHILASGALDAAWPVNGTTVCSVVGEQSAPVILSDGAGGAFIAWTDSRNPSTELDVFVQHVLASGLADPNWPANGTAVTTAPKSQTSPSLVGDGVGGILIAWVDTRSGNPGSDIFATHVFGSGVVDPVWPANGFGVSTALGTQAVPDVIPDGTHGAIVSWIDTRDGTNEIFAQRVTIAGAIFPGWPTDGRLVSIGGTDEVSPILVADGANGAIVVWSGGNTGHHNVRAQHLLASGALDAAWPATGRSLSFAPSEETNQGAVSDGAGGAIVSWQVSQDIEAQHVLASGALDAAYPVNGRPVCALPSAQHNPVIVAAGAGGAIVAWQDRRDDTDDIYALQVLEAGVVSVPPPNAPAEISFARPNPNPARQTATLRFALPREARVSLVIYDAGGRWVRELASGSAPAGEHAVTWDLSDEAGRPVGTGLYFARLEVEGRAFTQKLAALR